MFARLTILLVLFHSLMLSAATLDYNLTSRYLSPEGEEVTFILEWQEEEGVISGEYEDDQGEKEVKLTGLNVNENRRLLVRLPEYNLLIKTIGVTGAQTTTIPLEIFLMNDKFRALDQFFTKGQFVGEP